MKFNNDVFTMMHVTDIHQKPKSNSDTRKLLTQALEQEKPDLVIFTGDQLKGYGFSYWGKRKKEKVLQAFQTFLEPLVEQKIPFMVTFGNHDAQSGILNKDQLELYKTFPGFMPAEEYFDEGTGCIYVKDDKGSPAFALYLMDTKGRLKKGGYQGIGKEQLSWFAKTRFKEKENYGKSIKAMVFQHIPLEEYYQVLHEVPFRVKNAFWGHGKKKGRAYVLKNIKEGENFQEAPSIPDINAGAFEVFKEDQNVLAVFCGHDHKNNFVRSYMGIDLGYTPSCGFDEYGPGIDRGVRMIKVCQKQEEITYQTYVKTFRELCGTQVQHPIKNWFYKMIPTSKETAIQMLIKLLKVGTLLAGFLLLLLYIVSKF